MSYDSRRSDLFGYVKTQWAAGAFASTPIEFENKDTIDRNSQTAPFISVDMDYHDANQVSLETNPRMRNYGEVCFYIHVKEGQGTKPGLDRAEVIKNFMKFKQLNGMQFRAPRLLKPIPYDGWYIWPLRVSFYYDE